jgi:hypothetical protein
MTVKVKSIKEENKTYHIIGDLQIECSGQEDCPICSARKKEEMKGWELSVPFPIPPEGKRYKQKGKQANRGKTIKEICYTCKDIPCYICKRTKCPNWMKEKSRKGQEEGCASWDNGYCKTFVCDKGIIINPWA